MSDALSREEPSSPGIKDVAALAGVSIASVSNALNHRERVAPSTLERIDRAIGMLGYIPNGAARQLAAGGTRSFGLILSDLGNSLFVDIARGAERAAEERGLSVVLANSDGKLEREDRYVGLFAETRVRGVLLTLNDASHFRAIAGRHAYGQPIVMLNFHDDTGRYCTASIDNEAGGYLATAHLLETGRRRIVFVGGPDTLQPVADRRLGFLRALGEAGLAPVDVIAPAWVNRSDGWQVGRRLADPVLDGEVDGIVAASDLLAAGIVQALSEIRPISVPETVSVIGYDNNQAAWDAPIPISTISQPGEELGYLGAGLLIDEVEGAEHQHRAVRLAPTLIARRSTER
ncbi:LacI family DNA-binding transcriptional regulator [Agromyces sp. MMS24-JH15]|uniref:LacI family DNA-binding transcriptional regulator n=1 Tax=Agromyces sp. MMS24-JH15 TaxID=3243765 RepID=UPI003749B85F